MKSLHILLLSTIVALFINLTSCKKFLDAKPDQSLSIPDNVADLQAISDATYFLNQSGTSTPNIFSDDYYLSESHWLALSEFYKNAHVWDPNLDDESSWSALYKVVFYANTILDHLQSVFPEKGQEQQWNSIKGAALFYRSYALHQAAQLYAKPYAPNTASTDLGLPLRLSSDFNEKTTRATVEQTYNQIINDLKEASSLLPNFQLYKTRPSRPAAFAMLSRVFLQMGNYRKAKEYADSCLDIFDTLLDFNSPEINLTASIPFKRFNDEVIFHSVTTSATILSQSRAKIDTTLYQSYDSGDLRKVGFFAQNSDGSHAFKGNYDGSSGTSFFNGLAIDEVFLNRAECHARDGNINSAMSDLNHLLEKRWQWGTFTPVSASTPNEALILILNERRKELLFRGIRWSDLRRLNAEGANITLIRNLDGHTFSLLPNDKNYTILIPIEVVNLTGIPQNER